MAGLWHQRRPLLRPFARPLAVGRFPGFAVRFAVFFAALRGAAAGFDRLRTGLDGFLTGAGDGVDGSVIGGLALARILARRRSCTVRVGPIHTRRLMSFAFEAVDANG